MTMNDIIATERRNTDKIYLYLEGIFWKVYERSAFAFIHRISRYKPSKRFIKYLDTEVVSLGFPDASRAKVLGDRPLISATDDLLVLDAGAIGVEEYERWKEALPLIVPRNTTPLVGASSPRAAYTTAIYGDRTKRQVELPPVPEVESIPRRESRSVDETRTTSVVPPVPQATFSPKPPPTQTPNDDRAIAEIVLRDLRNFSVENATPLECLIFVSTLKKQLNGDLR